MKATAFARDTRTAIEPSTTRTVRQPLSLVRPGTRESPQHAPPVHLTPRQLEVLALLCEGLPNKLICRRLNISAGTVKVHISSILRELGVGSRLQAVVWARRRGLISDLNVPEDQHELGHDDQPMDATATTFRCNRALN
jgi:DNA-binding NarL/FixJ family response regulator